MPRTRNINSQFKIRRFVHFSYFAYKKLPASDLSMSFSHTITVLDFTAQIGLYALAQLSGSDTLTTATQQRCWRQLALAHVAGAPLVDWHRPAQVGDLEQLQPDVAATAVLMGPGSIHLLEAALGSDVLHTSKAVWIFLLPNAVLARHAIDAALRTRPHPNVQVFQLPNSDPKTLWFILMEQLGKLQVLASPPSLTDQHTMTTNLKESMNTAMGIDGAMAVALVDYRSGMCLAQAGSGMNLDLAAAGNAQVVQAKLKTVESLGLRKGIEDILITLADQYHLIRLVPHIPGMFLYLVLDKNKGNLALARYKLTDIERTLKV